jgi:hypothetical protein
MDRGTLAIESKRGHSAGTINSLSQSNAQAFSHLNFPPGLPATTKFPHPPPTYRTIFQQSRESHGKHPTPTKPQAKLRHSRRVIRLIPLEVRSLVHLVRVIIAVLCVEGFLGKELLLVAWRRSGRSFVVDAKMPQVAGSLSRISDSCYHSHISTAFVRDRDVYLEDA